MRNIYRAPERAYASMDFTGKGEITEENFLNSLIISRIPYTKEEVKEFLKQNNLFSTAEQGLNFDSFKKIFFPQLFLINEEHDSDEDKKMKKDQIEMK